MDVPFYLTPDFGQAATTEDSIANAMGFLGALQTALKKTKEEFGDESIHIEGFRSQTQRVSGTAKDRAAVSFFEEALKGECSL